MRLKDFENHKLVKKITEPKTNKLQINYKIITRKNTIAQIACKILKVNYRILND